MAPNLFYFKLAEEWRTTNWCLGPDPDNSQPVARGSVLLCNSWVSVRLSDLCLSFRHLSSASNESRQCQRCQRRAKFIILFNSSQQSVTMLTKCLNIMSHLNCLTILHVCPLFPRGHTQVDVRVMGLFCLFIILFPECGVMTAHCSQSGLRPAIEYY